VLSLQGGQNVDSDLLKNIKLGDSSFQDGSTKSSDFYNIIEPYSGFLI